MEACKKEKDVGMKTRLQAVCNVLECGKSAFDTAAFLFVSENSVRVWVKIYKEFGIDGLRDLPRSGRPTKVPREMISDIIKQVLQRDTNPFELQEMIKKLPKYNTACLKSERSCASAVYLCARGH